MQLRDCPLTFRFWTQLGKNLAFEATFGRGRKCGRRRKVGKEGKARAFELECITLSHMRFGELLTSLLPECK